MPAVPKPPSTKKSKNKATTKTVNQDAVNEKRRQQNHINRQAGKRAEQRVAKDLGGERTPLSGAVKYSNRNLTGDVEVRNAKGRDFMKIEVKNTAQFTASGEKSFTIKLPVIEQCLKEAHEAHEIAAVAFTFKGDGRIFYIFGGEDIRELVELAKLGALYEDTIERTEGS
jgi:hypothetical protein